jgi:glucan phosphoethanolaminetransferase (alkaline phosphatase superfamily)
MDKTMKTSYARSQYSTPFVVWMSDRYKATYPDVAKAVEQAKDRPYCHDLVGQMMLTLGRVKSSHYRSEDDVLSAGYKPGKRFIYVGNQKLDYDSLMRSRE